MGTWGVWDSWAAIGRMYESATAPLFSGDKLIAGHLAVRFLTGLLDDHRQAGILFFNDADDEGD
jgi:hypothetical protein